MANKSTILPVWKMHKKNLQIDDATFALLTTILSSSSSKNAVTEMYQRSVSSRDFIIALQMHLTMDSMRLTNTYMFEDGLFHALHLANDIDWGKVKDFLELVLIRSEQAPTLRYRCYEIGSTIGIKKVLYYYHLLYLDVNESTIKNDVPKYFEPLFSYSIPFEGVAASIDNIVNYCMDFENTVDSQNQTPHVFSLHYGNRSYQTGNDSSYWTKETGERKNRPLYGKN